MFLSAVDLSDEEGEPEGQDVKFINIPSLREESSVSGKDAAQPKQWWEICADTVVSVIQW